LIVTLGSAATKYLLPSLKGSAMNHVGETIYIKDIDTTVLIGFNPAMIYHDNDKQVTLNAIFQHAATILSEVR